MNRLLLCILIFFIPVGSLFAQAPSNYYDATNGLYGDSLKSVLHQIISGHTAVSYSQLHDIYPYTDSRPNNTVWDMYSDNPAGIPPYAYYFVPADQCGNYSQEGDCYNREHSFPKSWFGGTSMPMYTDLFHVYPTDGYVNGQRGNLPYGETSSATWTSLNGSKRGISSIPGYSGEVFEPIDEYKGDFARSYFYMAVRYFDEDNSWPGSDMVTGAEPKPWALDMLIQWHRSDSVSQKEIHRNNIVYNYQGNRNPFIDDPYFVDRIWTTSAGIGNASRISITCYPNPAKEIVYLQFSQTTGSGGLLQVIGTQGKNMLQQSIEDNTRKLKIDISTLPDGIYAVQYISNDSRLPIKSGILIVAGN